MTTRKNRRGTSAIEAVAAAIVLVPVALCLLDLIVIVIANSMNDTAAKNAARAAANQPDGPSAFNAARNAIQTFRSSQIVKSITIDIFDYPASKDAVTCQTRMVVHLPVPFPGFSEIQFVAKDVEPIVVK